jgi:hypothetical protein
VNPLFLPDGQDFWLPCADLAVRRGRAHLGFLFLRFLGFAVASLLALCHAVLPDLH